jgi:hypothetical protein
MADLKSVLQQLSEAAAELEQAALPLERATIDGADQTVEIFRGAMEQNIVQARELSTALEQTSVSLNGLISKNYDDILNVLRGVTQSELFNNIDESGDYFGARCQEASASVQAQLIDHVAQIGDELIADIDGAIEHLEDNVRQALGELGSEVNGFGEHLKDELISRVKERCDGAIHTVVDAAVQRALAELAEVLITTELGATITSVISPYLPEIIVIRRSVGAIQAALDAMRLGF